MELKCKKCGASVTSDQAFCPKCGAVVGMGDAAQSRGGEWDMAATVVGKQPPPAPPPRPSTPPSRPAPKPTPVAEEARPARASTQPAAPSKPARAPEPAARSGGNTMLLAVIGFIAVL